LKTTANGMVVRLRALVAEAEVHESDVGRSRGKWGWQAHVPGKEGVRLDVNRMRSSLTDQVRSIANVTTAIVKGHPKQKIEILVEARYIG